MSTLLTGPSAVDSRAASSQNAARRVAVLGLMGVAVASVAAATLAGLLPLREWLGGYPVVLLMVVAVLPVAVAGVLWWPALTSGTRLGRPGLGLATTLVAVALGTLGASYFTEVFDEAQWASSALMTGGWFLVLSAGLLLGPADPPGSRLARVGGSMVALLAVTYLGSLVISSPLEIVWVFVPLGVGLLLTSRTVVGVGFLFIGTLVAGPALFYFTIMPLLLLVSLGPLLLGAGLVLDNQRWTSLAWVLGTIGAEIIGVSMVASGVESYYPGEGLSASGMALLVLGLGFTFGPFLMPRLLSWLSPDASSTTALAEGARTNGSTAQARADYVRAVVNNQTSEGAVGMGKFLCVCGEVISTSNGIPNPNEWKCMSDEDLHGLPDEPIDWNDLYLKMTTFYRCPASDHIWAFWDGFGQPPALYTPTPYDDD